MTVSCTCDYGQELSLIQLLFARPRQTVLWLAPRSIETQLNNRHTGNTADASATPYAYGSWIVRHPWLVIAVVLLLSLAAISGARYLQNNPDNRVFFGKDNPELLALEYLEDTYTKTDNIFVAIEPQSGDVFSPRILQLVLDLTEQAWQIPYSSRVDSLSNFQHTRADADDLLVTDLVQGDEPLTEAYGSEIKRVAMSKPFLVNRLVSDDAAVTGLNVTILKPEDNTDAVFEVVDATRAIVADFKQQYPDVNFYLTGGAIFDVAFADIPASESAKLVPIMFGLILLIVGVSLRTAWATICVLVLMGISVGIAMGLTGWAGAVLNAGTTSAPVVIMTLSIAHCVHIVASMRQRLAEGWARPAAIVESLRVNMVPVFITSATTAIGFLTLNFSDSPPFQLLGNIVATGVAASFFLAVTLLPAILTLVNIKPPKNEGWLTGFMGSLGEFVVRHSRRLFWIVGIAILALSAGMTRITLDDNFLQYFSDRFEVRRHTDFIEQRLTGMNMIEFSLPAGSEGGISDPEYLANVERFTEWLRDQPKVTNVGAITQVMKDLNKSMHGDDEAYHRVPESRELAAQYLLMYEMSLPYGLDLNNTIDVSKSSSRVVTLLQEATSADLRDLNTRAERWLRDNTPQMQAEGSGLSMIFAYISERNINSMLFGSLLALFVISLILILALRSLRFGLVSLIPNLVPAFMALGLWGYLVGQVGLSVAVVVAITLGIVVDDTVHFLARYLRARRERGMAPEAAIKHTFRTVGVALWITSAALVAGFAVLYASGFKVNAEMGILSAATILLALAADFFFLPAVLLKIDKRAA